jgi:hypothetical protein
MDNTNIALELLFLHSSNVVHLIFSLKYDVTSNKERRVMKLPAYLFTIETTGGTGGTLCTCWLSVDGSPETTTFIHKLRIRARTKAIKSFFI